MIQPIKKLSLCLLICAAAIAGCSIVKTDKAQSIDESSTKSPGLKIKRELPAKCTTQKYTAEELFANSKNGIAVVLTNSGVGSAFVVKHENNSTLLVTNAHVVGGNSVVTLKWEDGSRDQAAVVKTGDAESLDNDLALLEIPGNTGKVLQIKKEGVNTGADIVAIGAPRGLEFTITRGIVSAHRQNGRVIQIDAPINPGNSGGAVLDQTGCVVGVATFIREDSEGLAFAISSGQLRYFLSTGVITRSNVHALSNSASLSSDSNESRNGRPKCWFQQTAGGDLEAASCTVSSRKNNNGHIVYDLNEVLSGIKRTIVLWQDDKAEILMNGKVYIGIWWTDSDGDIRVSVNGGEFAFVMPESIAKEQDLDRKADQIFYERYPELKGQVLGSSNGKLAKEWMNIRDSLK